MDTKINYVVRENSDTSIYNLENCTMEEPFLICEKIEYVGALSEFFVFVLTLTVAFVAGYMIRTLSN